MKLHSFIDPKIEKKVKRALKLAREGKIEEAEKLLYGDREKPKLTPKVEPIQKLSKEEQEKLNSELLEACEKGELNKVKDLLKRGADVHAKDNGDKTALMYASMSGHTDIVDLLINHGADVHAKDRDGSTALILASSNGHPDIVDLLKKRGAKNKGTKNKKSWWKLWD